MYSQSLREKLHHTCQTEYASAGGLKELDNVPEKKIFPKHVGDFYDIGVLARSYDTFNKIAVNAIDLVHPKMSHSVYFPSGLIQALEPHMRLFLTASGPPPPLTYSFFDTCFLVVI